MRNILIKFIDSHNITTRSVIVSLRSEVKAENLELNSKSVSLFKILDNFAILIVIAMNDPIVTIKTIIEQYADT